MRGQRYLTLVFVGGNYAGSCFADATAAFLLLHFSLGDPLDLTMCAVEIAWGGAMVGGTAPIRGVKSRPLDYVNKAWSPSIGEVEFLDFAKLDSNS